MREVKPGHVRQELLISRKDEGERDRSCRERDAKDQGLSKKRKVADPAFKNGEADGKSVSGSVGFMGKACLVLQVSRDTSRRKQLEQKQLDKQHKRVELALTQKGHKPFFIRKCKCFLAVYWQHNFGVRSKKFGGLLDFVCVLYYVERINYGWPEYQS